MPRRSPCSRARRAQGAWPSGLPAAAAAALAPSLVAVLAAALLGPAPAHALQVIEARDGVAVEAILSRREPTRIRIEGAAITDVFGSVTSSQCAAAPAAAAPPGLPVTGSAAGPLLPLGSAATNPGAEVVLECDRDKGEIYLRPTGASGKPVNLFIASATATYTLLLRHADTPADTIVIRDPTQGARHATADRPELRSPAPSHFRSLKAMLVAMATERLPADMRVEDNRRPVQLWAQVRFVQVRQYAGRGLVGEKYLLHNTSAQPLVLAEPEFDREGAQVAAIAIEQHTLRPGESTSVYVIRREDTP